MTSFWLAAGSALWFGLLTSISPCPLAANVAAVSYISKRLGRPSQIIVSGLLYTAGRIVAYWLSGLLVVAGLLSIPGLANFLQRYMNMLLGPVLIITGLVLLDAIRITFSSNWAAERAQALADKAGSWGAGLLGLLFALTFCPVSAALFFGSLIPLALQHHSRLLLPALYGIGTGLPVIAFALIIALSARSLGLAFKKLTQVERWLRRITGIVFCLAGLRYIATSFLGLNL